MAVLMFVLASCMGGYNHDITEKELKETVYYLASDSLKGRKSGEAGDSAAAAYIQSKLEKAGLEMLFDNGYQAFRLVTSAEPGDGNALTTGSNVWKLERWWWPDTVWKSARIHYNGTILQDWM